ncbi:MAG: hypothetical protein JO057_06550 [Chloroflexi bacterium]|nr:hypothetical protein [Chloroflexota bacterium]
MARFGPQERREFLQLKDLCYQGLDTHTLLATIGLRLAEALRADGTCMVQLDPATALPMYVISQGWPDRAFRPMIDHALLRTPTADPGRLVERGQRAVVTESLVANDQSFDRDPYFVHHILWGGFRHEIQTMCASGSRARALLTVTRRARSGVFDPKHLRLLDALAPHVAAAVRASAVRERLAGLNEGETGMIVLNENATVEMANVAGQRWLARDNVQGLPGYVWAVQVLASTLRYAGSADGADHVPEFELADPATGVLHLLHAERLQPEEAHRVLILIEPIRRVERTQTLEQMGLTHREAEIILGLLRGRATIALASDYGISHHTLIAHQRNAFAKLSVSSRRALMAHLFAGLQTNRP